MAFIKRTKDQAPQKRARVKGKGYDWKMAMVKTMMSREKRRTMTMKLGKDTTWRKTMKMMRERKL
jgi:hypothetical protein